MFWKHEIKVPPGFEAIVNGRIEERRPLRIWRDNQVYYVNFAPFFADVSTEAACKESVIHKVTVVVRLDLQRSNLVEILRDAGHSTYPNILRVSAQELATRQNVLHSINASIQTYIHSAGFFDLAKKEEVRDGIHKKVFSVCEKARLGGEIVSCDVMPVLPETSLLAQLAAKAEMDSDPNLGKIVEYFRETFRQAELIEAGRERDKAERQKEAATTRTEAKIHELQQENRVEAYQDQLQKEDAKRQQAAQERNAAIKEIGAAYEFKYKSKRLEEEMMLAQKEVEIAKVKDTEEAALRQRKRLDMQLETEHERELSTIRAEEKAGMLTPLEGLLDKLGKIPPADYKNIQTLITTAGFGGMDSKDFATGLVLGLLGKAAEGIGIPSGESEEKK